MLRNMAASLLRHETIRTTVPKAKELRRFVEPLITLGKTDSAGEPSPGVLAPARRRGRRPSCSTSWARASRRVRAATRASCTWRPRRRQRRHGADAAGRSRGAGRRGRRPPTTARRSRRPARRRRPTPRRRGSRCGATSRRRSRARRARRRPPRPDRSAVAAARTVQLKPGLPPDDS